MGSVAGDAVALSGNALADLPEIGFQPMVGVRDEDGMPRSPPVFKVRPEAILERRGEYVPKLIFAHDAALVMELAGGRWTVGAFTQMQRGMRSPCSKGRPSDPLIAWTSDSHPGRSGSEDRHDRGGGPPSGSGLARPT